MIKRLIFKALGIAITLGVGLPLIFFLLVYNDFFGKVPGDDEIMNIKNLEASIVYEKKRSSGDWERVVFGMKARGLKITADEEKELMSVLKKYLTRE